MNEKRIVRVAGEFGLTVLKRITTGGETGHFARFELSGERQQVHDACDNLREPDAFVKLEVCDNPEHPDKGQTFVAIDSVWCETVDRKEAGGGN